MRWERLFDDLEAQWAADVRAGEEAEVADRTRRERAAIRLGDRLVAHAGSLELLLLGGRRVSGVPADVGVDFVVVREGSTQRLVPLSAIVQLTGLTRYAAGAGEVAAARRFGLPSALRVIARDRSPVVLDDISGRALTGTIDAVGADYVEVVEHPLDRPRRAEDVQARRVVPLAALVCVSSV